MGRLNDLQEKVLQLEQENAILREATDIDAQTIRSLRADLAATPGGVQQRIEARKLKEELAVARAAVKIAEDERDNVAAERDTASAERDRAVTDLRTAEMNYASLDESWKAMKATLDKVIGERADLRSTLDAVEAQRNALAEKLEKLKSLPAVQTASAVHKAALELQDLKNENELLQLKNERLEKAFVNNENLTKSQKRRVWRYVSADGVQPKAGERYLCLCADLRGFCDKLASRHNSGTYETPVRDVRYLGDYVWNRADIPEGHIVVAWQPMLAVNEQRITDTVIEAIHWLRTDLRLFAKILCDTGRARQNIIAEKKYLADLIKRLDSAFDQRKKRTESAAGKLARKLMVV